MKRFLQSIAVISFILAIIALILVIDNKNNEIVDLKNDNQILQTQQTQLESNITLLIDEKTSIEKQKEEVVLRLEEKTVEFNACKKNSQSLSENVERLTLRINSMNDEIQSLNSNISEMTAELEILRQSQEDNTAVIVELENSIAEKVSELEILTANVDDLQSQLSEKNTELELLNDSLSAFEIEITNLNNQITNLQVEIAEKDAEIANLVASLNAENDLFHKLVNGSITKITAADLGNIYSIRQYAFYNCYSLTEIEIPDTVMEIGNYAFYGCNNLKTVKINETSNLQYLRSYAFQGCSKLESLFVPKKVSLLDSNAFSSASLSNGLTFAVNNASLKVETQVFVNNKGLKELILPEGTKTLSGRLVYNSVIEKVVIPSTVTSVGFNLFESDSSLKIVVIKSTSLQPSSFSHNGTVTISEAIYVPDSKVEDYKASANFANFVDIIKPLSEYVG